ncbi:MAG: hypothetical protein AABW65_02645 [Nanoarchaeota archaeon]
MCLTREQYRVTSGIIFLIIAILHLWRAVAGLEAVINGIAVPIWFSWILFIVSGYLAYSAFKLKK